MHACLPRPTLDRALTKLQISAPNLTLLHIGGCKTLRSLSLRCPRLTQLLANLCFSLTELDPQELQVPRLESLNLFGCRHISSADVAALVGRAPGVRLLNLNGCSGLRRLELPGTSCKQPTLAALVARLASK